MAVRYEIRGHDPITNEVVEEYHVPRDVFEEACRRLRTDPDQMVGEQLISAETANLLLRMEGVIVDDPLACDWFIGPYVQG